MGKLKHSPSVAEILDRWVEAIYHVKIDLGAHHTRLQWRTKADPWPTLPKTIKRDTEAVVSHAKEYYCEADCFTRLYEVCRRWVTSKSSEGIPETRLIRLDWLIARTTLDRLLFPLNAQEVFKSPFQSSQVLLDMFVRYAIHVWERWSDVRLEWTPGSDERHLFYQSICPRYIRDVSRTPLALCTEEARQSNALDALRPLLKALDEAINEYSRESIDGTPLEPSPLNKMTNELITMIKPRVAGPLLVSAPKTLQSESKTEIQLVKRVNDVLLRYTQFAAFAGRKKRTLERHLKKGKLPEPDRRGGGGKPHLWYWSTIRPALQSYSNRPLPDEFPGDPTVF